MYPFAYSRAASVDEAADVLRSDPEAKVMAGGMSLIPAMKLRLAAISRLVDLASVPHLAFIRQEGDRVRIGAMTRHYDVASSPLLKERIPALASLALGIGDVQVRYRGTIGGSVANADPAADYPAAVLGLGATVVTNRRAIRGDDFFQGLFDTALQPGEIITAFEFPEPLQAVYLKFPNLASRFAIVGLFLARYPTEVRIAITGAASHVFRLEAFEKALAKRFETAAIDGLTVSDAGFTSDVHAPADYRAHLIGVLARRAVELCRASA